MSRFRKRPVEVEAVQWRGPGPTSSAAMEFAGTRTTEDGTELVFVPLAYPTAKLWVEANQAWVQIEPGEWLIRDSRGIYPCKPDIFDLTYEPVA